MHQGMVQVVAEVMTMARGPMGRRVRGVIVELQEGVVDERVSLLNCMAFQEEQARAEAAEVTMVEVATVEVHRTIGRSGSPWPVVEG